MGCEPILLLLIAEIWWMDSVGNGNSQYLLLDTDVNMLSCFWWVVKTVERGKKKKSSLEKRGMVID